MLHGAGRAMPQGNPGKALRTLIQPSKMHRMYIMLNNVFSWAMAGCL